MFPFWFNLEMTAVLQVLAAVVATAAWLVAILAGRGCGA